MAYSNGVGCFGHPVILSVNISHSGQTVRISRRQFMSVIMDKHANPLGNQNISLGVYYFYWTLLLSEWMTQVC